MMLEELKLRNYSDGTARGYISAVADFAKHFGKPPDQLGPDELRRYQAYLLKKRKLAVGTVIARVAALRFFFVRTLKRHEFRQDLPYPKEERRLPTTKRRSSSSCIRVGRESKLRLLNDEMTQTVPGATR